MTNPAAAMRMLITYAICIPVAILVGWLLTNPMDYGTLGFLAFIMAVLMSPLFIKWHYQFLIFGLACPMTCFFLVGRPPLLQVVVLVSFGIAIVERSLSAERRFISAPVMFWPILFIAAMAYMTAKLTGGIGLHSLGGETGGGKKYIALFVGCATFFALTCRKIPRNHWKGYLMLFMLPGVLGTIGGLSQIMPGPLKYLNLLFPPTGGMMGEVSSGSWRLTAVASTVGIVPMYLMARYGLRGIFMGGTLWRPALYLACFGLTMLGGFRNNVAGFMLLFTIMFFLEGLHRSRLVPALIFAVALGSVAMATCSDKLPYPIQRAMCFLPFKWNQAVVTDAQGSTEWRLAIWRALAPKVPEYLLLGKGYALTREDFDQMGTGTFALRGASTINAEDQGLAISGDYHSGPLSTLIPFGIWGAIGILWLMGATLFVAYRNYRYGPEELKVFNTYTLAVCLNMIIYFIFIFGSFSNDVGSFAKLAGFSIAMNWGIAKRPAPAKVNPRIKPLPSPAAAPQTG